MINSLSRLACDATATNDREERLDKGREPSLKLSDWVASSEPTTSISTCRYYSDIPVAIVLTILLISVLLRWDPRISWNMLDERGEDKYTYAWRDARGEKRTIGKTTHAALTVCISPLTAILDLHHQLCINRWVSWSLNPCSATINWDDWMTAFLTLHNTKWNSCLQSCTGTRCHTTHFFLSRNENSEPVKTQTFWRKRMTKKEIQDMSDFWGVWDNFLPLSNYVTNFIQIQIKEMKKLPYTPPKNRSSRLNSSHSLL